MELDDFLVGLWKWVGAGGEFLAPVACMFLAVSFWRCCHVLSRSIVMSIEEI